jgi:hypothetical protein
VFVLVPLARPFLEAAPAFLAPGTVPVTGTVTVSMPAETASSAQHPADQEDRSEQEQWEQEEPREEHRTSITNDMDDLDFLAVLLSHLDLLDTLGDAVALARSIRADPDADPSEDHHQ